MHQRDSGFIGQHFSKCLGLVTVFLRLVMYCQHIMSEPSLLRWFHSEETFLSGLILVDQLQNCIVISSTLARLSPVMRTSRQCLPSILSTAVALVEDLL
ncbi:hypothetical protein TNCV_4449911 [Trichonephila clavipes]|nr:hypothetical protein TNCV_4449911 [Trichonephila clavipes]